MSSNDHAPSSTQPTEGIAADTTPAEESILSEQELAGFGTPVASVDQLDMQRDTSAPAHMDSRDSAEGSTFFADAMLDLDEAHDIAETPEPPLRGTVNVDSFAPSLLTCPELEQPTLDETAAGAVSLAPSSTRSMQKLTNNPVIPPKTANYRPRPPRQARDVPWLISFCIYCPLVLLTCSLLGPSEQHGSHVALDKAPRRATFFALTFALVGTVALARLLYKTVGGGEGEDARHVASQVLLAFAPISLGVHPLLILLILLKTPHALGYALIPLWFLLRDVWAMRQWRTTASTAGGRLAFFQAMCNMSLDILSRSLRRSSFYRVILWLLGIQFVMILIWRRALIGALGRGSVFWFILALVAGRWATGTVARILGLVASGGVTNWFVQQSLLMEELAKKRQAEEENGNEEEAIGDSNLLEEYRNVEASAYQPVMELDEGIDDDFDNEDDVQGIAGIWNNGGNSTVKALLISAFTTSFGSVAQCGLLGGLAQFVWSALRNMDGILRAMSQRFPSSRLGGFQGMEIGGGGDGAASSVVAKFLSQSKASARSFVRTHSDLALCHVAAYYKSYQRAAQDVAVLVDGAGVEPIIHDDISTHICACVCSSIAGIIVMFFGLILDHHQVTDHIRDKTVVQSMLLAFVLCYVLLFTVMEPLRASIKAVYVSFAQNPESLSQTFPLIFHRLTRISEANLV